MQVPPHMREAGGVLPTFPSHAHRGQQVWAAGMGSRHGQQVWVAGVGSRCGQQARLIVGKLGCWDNVTFNRDGLRNARAV